VQCERSPKEQSSDYRQCDKLDAITLIGELTGVRRRNHSTVRPEREVLRSGYLGFGLEPMFQIVTGNVSTRGKKMEGPLGDIVMGRLDGCMTLFVLLRLSRRVVMN
jgi:hypothetical protein